MCETYTDYHLNDFFEIDDLFENSSDVFSSEPTTPVCTDSSEIKYDLDSIRGIDFTGVPVQPETGIIESQLFGEDEDELSDLSPESSKSSAYLDWLQADFHAETFTSLNTEQEKHLHHMTMSALDETDVSTTPVVQSKPASQTEAVSPSEPTTPTSVASPRPTTSTTPKYKSSHIPRPTAIKTVKQSLPLEKSIPNTPPQRHGPANSPTSKKRKADSDEDDIIIDISDDKEPKRAKTSVKTLPQNESRLRSKRGSLFQKEELLVISYATNDDEIIDII